MTRRTVEREKEWASPVIVTMKTATLTDRIFGRMICGDADRDRGLVATTKNYQQTLKTCLPTIDNASTQSRHRLQADVFAVPVTGHFALTVQMNKTSCLYLSSEPVWPSGKALGW